MAEPFSEQELLTLIEGLALAELRAFIAAGWVRPMLADDGSPKFQEVDVARVRLIAEFRAELAIGDEAMPVLLSLLDQLHSVRHRLACVARALEAQPEGTRAALMAAIAGELSRSA